MIRMIIGVFIIIVGLFVPSAFLVYLMLGGFIFLSGFVDNDFKISKKTSIEKKEIKKKRKIRDYSNRFKNNPLAIKYIDAYVESIIKRNASSILIEYDGVNVDNQKSKFSKIDMKNLDEEGCIAMGEIIVEKLKERLPEKRIYGHIKDHDTSVYNPNGFSTLPRIHGDGGPTYMAGSLSEGRIVFDGYAISISNPVIIEAKKEGSREW